jgi:uncharacterized membrane protein
MDNDNGRPRSADTELDKPPADGERTVPASVTDAAAGPSLAGERYPPQADDQPADPDQDVGVADQFLEGDTVAEQRHGGSVFDAGDEGGSAAGRGGDDRPAGARPGPMALVTVLAVAVGAAAFAYGYRASPSRRGAPTSLRQKPGMRQKTDPIARRDLPEITGATVTIAAKPADLYRRWRRYEDFDAFMPEVKSVTPRGGDDRVSDWTIEGPGGAPIQLVSRIVEDVPGRRIGWEAKGGVAAHSGVVTFEEAARGTQVRLQLKIDPPLGRIGAIAGSLLGKPTGTGPRQQARKALKRLKQLVETGEIARISPDDGKAGSGTAGARA